MKSSAEVEREVETARGQIDETVEALKEKLQPRELFDEATRIMGSTSNKVLTTVVEQARENPIPIALIGAGVAWLALSQAKRATAAPEGYYETWEGYDDSGRLGERIKARAKGALTTAKTRLDAATAEVKDGLTQAKSKAAEGTEAARSRAATLAAEARGRAAVVSRQAQARFQETLDQEPLILAALGLAVGAAIGASLPVSKVERRYLGPTRDKLVGRGRELAESSIGDVKDVAQKAYGQVKEELQRQTGLAGEGASLSEKAGAIADAGAQVVREEVDTRFAH
jgi:hypothetical protein